MTRMLLSVPTEAGEFLACYSETGLRQLDFPPLRRKASRSASPVLPDALRRWHAMTCLAVRAVLSGQPCPPPPPLDLSGATAFQQQVWQVLQNIPPGQVRAYGEIAAALGRPGAARAIGTACGANPIPLLIPCHRVVQAGGRLGGFSAGLTWKRRLLCVEGHHFEGDLLIVSG